MYIYIYAYIYAYVSMHTKTSIQVCVYEKNQNFDFSTQMNYVGFLSYKINTPHYIKPYLWDFSALSYVSLI